MTSTQLTQIEIDNCDLPSHLTVGMTYDEANRHISLINLKSKFPTASEQVWDRLVTLKLEDYTMNRVFANLLKIDHVFTLQPTDDLSILDRAIEEAIPFRLWVENSDENAPRPEFMAWKEGMPSYSMIPSDSTEDDAPPISKSHKTASTGDSPRKRAMAVYADHVARGIPKSETIKEYMEVLKLRPATAQVYYSNAKTAAKRG